MRLLNPHSPFLEAQLDALPFGPARGPSLTCSQTPTFQTSKPLFELGRESPPSAYLIFNLLWK